jgi:hypothetical protein
MSNIEFSSYYLGNLKYKFDYPFSQEKSFDGPNIFINYKNFECNDENLSCSVEINSSRCNLPIDLSYQDATSTQWHPLNDIQYYTSCHRWQLFRWNSLPKNAASFKATPREDKS